MAKTMKAIIALGGKLDGSLLKTMSTAEKRMARLKKAAAIGAMAATAIGAAAARGVKASIDAAAEYETHFAKTSTLLKKGTDLSAYSEDILKLSDQTGIAAGELADSVYQALSASVDQADALEFAGQAARLASGGFTSSSKAIDVLTTVMNSYGKQSGLTAESVSDMLVTTQNLGKTTVEDLASSMGKVIPIARTYGTNMENLSASYAIMTKGGIQTADSTTYLKGMINELGKESSTVSQVLKSSTGKSFSQLQKDGASLYDVLDILNKSVDGDSDAFANLWKKQTAATAAMALMNAGSEEYNNTLKAMQESSGATADAAGTMGDTYAKQVKKLNNLFENLKIRVGEKILPALTQGLEEAMPYITEAMQGLASGIGGLFDGLGNASGFFEPIASGIANAASALEEHAPAIQNIAEKLGPVFESLGEVIGGAFQGAATVIGEIVDKLSALLDLCDQAYQALGGPLEILSQHPDYVSPTGTTADPGGYDATAGAIQDFNATSMPSIDMGGIDAMASGMQAAQSSADAANSSISSAQDSSAALLGSVNALPGAANTGMASFAALSSGINGSMRDAESTVSSACSSMQSAVNGMSMQIPTITVSALPHFSMSGTFDPKTGAVPSVNVSYYAKGGFTDGPIAIAGEAGTEAIISFDPRYHGQNVGYWMQAGQMLGVLNMFEAGGFTGGLASSLSMGFVSGDDALSAAAGETNSYGSSGTSVNLGGVTFAPQITVSGADEQDVMSQIRAARDEFEDWLMELVGDMEEDYAYAF